MAWPDQGNGNDTIGGDRRNNRRYPIQLELRWKLIRRRKVQDMGVGHTLDFSSSGILIDAERALPARLNIELSISWPILLHNVAPMQLVVTGRIVRTEGTQVAIRMTQHEFRTVGIPADHRDVLARASRTPGLLANLTMSNFGKLQ